MLATHVQKGWSPYYQMVKRQEYDHFEMCANIWYREYTRLSDQVPNLFQLIDEQHPIHDYMLDAFISSFYIEVYEEEMEDVIPPSRVDAIYEIAAANFEDFSKRVIADLRLFFLERRVSCLYDEGDGGSIDLFLSPLKEVW